MIREGDKIAVCPSGGKDPCFWQQYGGAAKHSDVPFWPCFSVMTWAMRRNWALPPKNAAELGVPCISFVGYL